MPMLDPLIEAEEQYIRDNNKILLLLYWDENN